MTAASNVAEAQPPGVTAPSRRSPYPPITAVHVVRLSSLAARFDIADDVGAHTWVPVFSVAKNLPIRSVMWTRRSGAIDHRLRGDPLWTGEDLYAVATGDGAGADHRVEKPPAQGADGDARRAGATTRAAAT
jgi:hypothetical protein